MNKRILHKKLKKDKLVNLWINHFNHTLNLLQYHMLSINNENYNDKTSLWYCQFKIYERMMRYEFIQAIKIGAKRYNVKEKQIYNFILPDHFLSYSEYKKLNNI